MAQPEKLLASAAKAATAPKIKLPDGNPVFRMLGLPRIRARLPSRNWLIFLSITGSLAGAVIYDRRCKKQIQRKWCNLVAPLASECISTAQLPRKVTVYLSAPPGDGLRVVREHFTQYVKPILVAAAYDWETVEGWREGDLRAEVAERIRTLRKKSGEQSPGVDDQEEDLVAAVQRKAGVRPADGFGGDVVIGRHSWKEYVRGLHEGWLGPLTREEPAGDAAARKDSTFTEAPSENLEQTSATVQQSELESPASSDVDSTGIASTSTGVESASQLDQAAKTPAEEKAEDPSRKKPERPTPPYILPSDYPNHTPAPSMPTFLAPAEPLPFPHILGFLNTPIRLQRFLTRRHLADEIGAQVASVILASETRHWSSASISPDASDPATLTALLPGSPLEDSRHWEQQAILQHEEDEWHKSARQPSKSDEDPAPERPLLEPMVVDARIGGRMTRFAMTADAMQRARDAEAQLIAEQQKAHSESTAASWWRAVKTFAGFDLAAPRGLGWKDGLVGSEAD